MRSRIDMSSIREDFRMQEHRILHPQWQAEQIAKANEYDARQTDALAMPVLQQAALLQMYESHVKRSVIARLLEDAQDKPDTPDYRALVERDLATRNLGKRFHELTPAGVIAAKRLEQVLCVRFDIHLFLDKGPVGWQQKYACTCGKDYFVRRSPTAPGNARRQWAAEHATQDGITKLIAALKPPGMAAEG